MKCAKTVWQKTRQTQSDQSPGVREILVNYFHFIFITTANRYGYLGYWSVTDVTYDESGWQRTFTFNSILVTPIAIALIRRLAAVIYRNRLDWKATIHICSKLYELKYAVAWQLAIAIQKHEAMGWWEGPTQMKTLIFERFLYLH